MAKSAESRTDSLVPLPPGWRRHFCSLRMYSLELAGEIWAAPWHKLSQVSITEERERNKEKKNFSILWRACTQMRIEQATPLACLRNGHMAWAWHGYGHGMGR